MNNNFNITDRIDFVPIPVYDEHPEYIDFYYIAWKIAADHIRYIDGMPQNPYMDEAFCDTQVWIWDTCFMSMFCKFAQKAFPGVETLKNFYEVLYDGKSLPEIIPGENEPSWTGAVPGVKTNIKVHLADNPPLFAWSEYENALISGDIKHVKKLLYKDKYLQKHYEWFENLKEKKLLPNVLNPTNLIHEENGYKWEGGSSGMDNTPRGRTTEKADKERPNNPNMYWIDAICQQALSANMIAKLFDLCGDENEAEKWRNIFKEKADKVNSLYFDEKDGFYYDIDCRDNSFYKVKTIASFWVLTASIASKERARSLVGKVTDPKCFGGDVPLVSLSRDDSDFSPNGKYWRGALWLPTAYAALKGLEQYGFFKEAHDCAIKIVAHMYKTFLEYSPHTIWECYSPDFARPATPAHDKGTVRKDFCGWSALGPISIFIEYALGFYSINAFTNTVKWNKPKDINGKIGIKNLRFGDVITDIIAEDNYCSVVSNKDYILIINEKKYSVIKGKNTFSL